MRRAAVRVEVRPSRILSVVLCVLHAVGAAVLVPLEIGISAKLVLLTVISASLARGLWLHGLLRARSSVVAFEADNRERARVLTRDGRWREVDILGSTYVSPELTVLNLREGGRSLPRHVVLVPDNVDAERYRALRVILRWAHPSPAS